METISQKGARYQQVSVALAKQIVEGKYAIGEKIKSRTTLSSNFNVSPETARKAINIEDVILCKQEKQLINMV